MPLVDEKSDEVTGAQILVTVLGAGNYTYAEATLSQGLADWRLATRAPSATQTDCPSS